LRWKWAENLRKLNGLKNYKACDVQKKQAKHCFGPVISLPNHIGFNRLNLNFMTFIDLPTQRHIISLHGMVQGLVTINRCHKLVT
jgi:hypothetical protein